LIPVTPIGGHIAPNSTAGANALWKNPQKNDAKNTTSDNINNNIPHFNPLCTINV
jgi:hypothetical protein